MRISKPIERSGLPKNINRKYKYLMDMVSALNEKEIPDDFAESSNEMIERLNEVQSDDTDFKKQLFKVKSRIYKQMTTELKYVPKGYYQTIWMSVGMAAFGIPFGVMFGAALDNMAFRGIGLPIGMPIGMALGAGLDQKAAREGRQLNIKINL